MRVNQVRMLKAYHVIKGQTSRMPNVRQYAHSSSSQKKYLRQQGNNVLACFRKSEGSKKLHQ